MPMLRPSLAMIGLVAAGLALPFGAQSQSIIISNADNRTIPLEANSTVQVDASGNLVAKCALTSGACSALSSPTGVGVPTMTFARNDTNTEVLAGETITLTWASTDALVCNATATGPTSAWAGPKATANAAGQVISIGAQGNYVFGLSCFNANGGSTQQSVAVSAGPASTGGGGTSACTLTGPLIAPISGLTRVDKTWVSAFSAPNNTAIAVYPNSISSPTPLGADKGKYTVISFVPTANLDVQMTYDTAQAQQAIGYSPARPTTGGMFVGISPCPGDLRPPNDSPTAEAFERSVCRKFDTTPALSYSTRAAANASIQCKLEAGVTYYINVAPIDTSDGFTNPENSCGNNLSGCDVQGTHKKQ